VGLEYKQPVASGKVVLFGGIAEMRDMHFFVMPSDACVGPDKHLADIGGAGRVLRITCGCHAGKDRDPMRRRRLTKPFDRQAVVKKFGHLIDPVEAGTGLFESAKFGKDDQIDRAASRQPSVDGGRDAS